MPLFLKWSLRDLRARWVQVAAIALIIAIGSGLYSGLSSTSEWRRVSYDASFEKLHMYDLHAALSTGSYVDAAQMTEAVRTIPHAADVRAAEARLILPTQVDASRKGKAILVPGRTIGVDVSGRGPHVNGIFAKKGRSLQPDDTARNHAVVESHFANHYHLPAQGQIRVSGGATLDYVGQGLSPEYFMVIGERGNLLAEANFAVVFVPLDIAQQIADRPGAANDLVLTLRPGANRTVIERELRDTLAARFPDVGATFNGRRGDDAYRILYDDIGGDQRFYDIFALLILAGAAFAAFNLTGRIVEAQRREIGIGMAIGVPRRRLAIRPMLVGAEVALLGVVFGVGVGLLVAVGMGSVFQTLQPLPTWRFPFQPGVFLRGAALGFALPLVATAFPVWRAVRVPPVEAIRTGYLSAKSSGLAPLLARVPLPGRSTTQMPFRNVLRAPRRTLMTLLGIAAAIVVLVGVLGIVDSFIATIDTGATELGKTSPNRLAVGLDSFYPDSSQTVTHVEQSPLVASAEPYLELPGTLEANGTKINSFVDLMHFESRMWHPTIHDRVTVDGLGIVLSEKAARDLRVRPGDNVILRHPLRDGPTSYRLVRTKVPVIGTNPIPLRGVAFMDIHNAGLMNLEGITNSLRVNPTAGVSDNAVKRGLFRQPGVASVQRVSAYTDTISQQVRSRLDILRIVEVAVLLLALLIAFNSASINADERAREEATMFAFGMRLRSVLRIGTVESMVIGVLGTAVGLVVGWFLLDWLVTALLPQTFPDLGLITAVSGTTWLTAVGLGVLAVTIAPLLTSRKLRRMDIPSTLRVME